MDGMLPVSATNLKYPPFSLRASFQAASGSGWKTMSAFAPWVNQECSRSSLSS